MTSDIRAEQAREHHRFARELAGRARRHRFLRNRLILALREERPEYWTYVRLAFVVHCSPELIAKIVREGGDNAWADPEGESGRAPDE